MGKVAWVTKVGFMCFSLSEYKLYITFSVFPKVYKKEELGSPVIDGQIPGCQASKLAGSVKRRKLMKSRFVLGKVSFEKKG